MNILSDGCLSALKLGAEKRVVGVSGGEVIGTKSLNVDGEHAAISPERAQERG